MIVFVCVIGQPCDRIAHKVDVCGMATFRDAMETVAGTELAAPDTKIRFWCGPEKDAP